MFDGASFALDADCALRVQAPAWREALVADATGGASDDGWTVEPGAHGAAAAKGSSAIYHAMVLGLRDYVRKNRFPGVVLGLSGGIDSALTAAVAVDALGADQVHCVMMPSPYTSQDSLEDAAAVRAAARRASCAASISSRRWRPSAAMLAPSFAGRAPDITEENIQSRARGMTLMALSNKFGWMVLSTGNKSEMSVGYATLYGDMCGGYAVLKDVYKMTVFALSRWRNAASPDGLLGPAGRGDARARHHQAADAPSCKPNQTDQDTLPPYDDARRHPANAWSSAR